jgi:hypothetical protein
MTNEEYQRYGATLASRRPTRYAPAPFPMARATTSQGTKRPSPAASPDMDMEPLQVPVQNVSHLSHFCTQTASKTPGCKVVRITAIG